MGSNVPVMNESLHKNNIKWMSWVARSQFKPPLKFWIFQASLCHWYNCIHNCEDHSFTWISYPPFIVWFILYIIFSIDSFSRGPFEPTKDQVSPSVPSISSVGYNSLLARNTIPSLGQVLNLLRTEGSQIVYPVWDSKAKNPCPVQWHIPVQPK